MAKNKPVLKGSGIRKDLVIGSGLKKRNMRMIAQKHQT
jgi:hypothetical protein